MTTFSRRDMIELGLAGAAAALPAAASAQGGPMRSGDERVGFAVVGLGKLALNQIIPPMPKTRGVRLAALVSGHPDKAERVARENGVKPSSIYSYETFDRIARDPGVQVVYIVLPNSMHAEYTIRALKAGKHVICEKPMATSVADAEAMVAAAKAADRKLMIAYRCQYDVTNLTAMRQVRDGALGKPRIVVTDMGRQADPNDPSDAWRLDMKMSGGGALADMGIYGINASRYLLNEEPVEVRAWQDTSRGDPRFRTVPDLVAWQFRFPSGAVSNGSTSFDYDATMAYQVWGEKARLVADPGCFYNGNHLSLVHGGSRTPIPVAEADQFAREMDWMADVVRGRAPMVSPGEEGVQDMKLMHAILESVRTGAPVRTDWGYRRAYDPAAVVRT
jgi:glucose-fructose oxidoreductase